jgi:hypothetical protein
VLVGKFLVNTKPYGSIEDNDNHVVKLRKDESKSKERRKISRVLSFYICMLICAMTAASGVDLLFGVC